MLASSFTIEYLRPWKLISLAAGIVLLVIGSIYLPAPDWDIPISLIMAIATYLCAPFCTRVLYERRWARLPIVILLTWLSIDGCYALYWRLKDPVVLETMRSANCMASLPLFWLCGMLWVYRGDLNQLLKDIRSAF